MKSLFSNPNYISCHFLIWLVELSARSGLGSYYVEILCKHTDTGEIKSTPSLCLSIKLFTWGGVPILWPLMYKIYENCFCLKEQSRANRHYFHCFGPPSSKNELLKHDMLFVDMYLRMFQFM